MYKLSRFMIDLIVEGWRFIPHSYSIFNQFQCLEFLKRTTEVNLFHRDMPYFGYDGEPITGLFKPEDEVKLQHLMTPLKNQKSDVTLRINYPYNLEPANSEQTFVFATSELGVIFPDMLWNNSPLQLGHRNSNVVIVAPSEWSKKGFIYSGADPERVIVIPLGVDPKIFYPLPSQERHSLRQELGWDGFIFLSIGSITYYKGIYSLLKAFAVIVEQYPQARLVLKGLDSLYLSEDLLNELLNDLTFSEIENILPRLSYIGENLSFPEMAQLYQAADVYVSPYMAEGFNIPVLEAVACGLPVICTKGGPTDDFTNSNFALHIESQLNMGKHLSPDHQECFILIPDLDHLIELMKQSIEDEDFRKNAHETGVEFILKGFTYKHVIDRFLEIFN